MLMWHSFSCFSCSAHILRHYFCPPHSFLSQKQMRTHHIGSLNCHITVTHAPRPSFWAPLSFFIPKIKKNTSHWIVELPHHHYTCSEMFFLLSMQFFITKTKWMHHIGSWNRHITVNTANRKHPYTTHTLANGQSVRENYGRFGEGKGGIREILRIVQAVIVFIMQHIIQKKSSKPPAGSWQVHDWMFHESRVMCY